MKLVPFAGGVFGGHEGKCGNSQPPMNADWGMGYAG
jgi:hypothetical protein